MNDLHNIKCKHCGKNNQFMGLTKETVVSCGHCPGEQKIRKSDLTAGLKAVAT